MISNNIIFYISSFIILSSALFALFNRSLINSLLWAIVTFLSVAIIFYALGSEYNAIIQASIYGLAVPVIIGVSIMFTGSNKEKRKMTPVSYLAILCAGILALAFVYIIMMSLIIQPDTFNVQPLVQITAQDCVKAFGNGIYGKYVYAFELISVLLTIIVAGITILDRKGGQNK